MTTDLPFPQRIGYLTGSPVENDFPKTAQIALVHLLDALNDHGYLIARPRVVSEMLRTARLTGKEFGQDGYTTFRDEIQDTLEQMQWFQVYIFCERVFDHLLTAGGYYQNPGFEDGWVETTSLVDVRKHFEREVNQILAEENLAYQFVDGRFQRRGRAHTQKIITRMGTVLSDPKLKNVRKHYNKALEFFNVRPNVDAENCIKEAVCALEACLEELTGYPASQSFAREIKKLRGNGERQIPDILLESMIKIHAYRGDGQGIAHAAMSGSKVTEVEAELLLNLVASYVTYLVDVLSTEEDIPF